MKISVIDAGNVGHVASGGEQVAYGKGMGTDVGIVLARA